MKIVSLFICVRPLVLCVWVEVQYKRIKIRHFRSAWSYLYLSFDSFLLLIVIFLVFYLLPSRFIMQRKSVELNRHRATIRHIKRNGNYITKAMMITIMIISLKMERNFWIDMKLIHWLVSKIVNFLKKLSNSRQPQTQFLKKKMFFIFFLKFFR